MLYTIICGWNFHYIIMSRQSKFTLFTSYRYIIVPCNGQLELELKY